YLKVSPTNSVTGKDMREYARNWLLETMIPSYFVFLEQFPLTVNGKLDRKALPHPEPARATVTDTVAAPQTDVERLLVEAWQEVLQVEQVSMHDNFFELGGHSLHMIRVYGKLHPVLGDNLTLVDLFQYTTIQELADYLNKPEITAQLLQNSQKQGKRQKETLRKRRQILEKRRQVHE